MINKKQTEDSRQFFLKKWLDLIGEKEDGTQAIYNAMAEYAKQECINYTIWIRSQYLICGSVGGTGMFEMDYEPMYELYIKSKGYAIHE